MQMYNRDYVGSSATNTTNAASYTDQQVEQPLSRGESQNSRRKCLLTPLLGNPPTFHRLVLTKTILRAFQGQFDHFKGILRTIQPINQLPDWLVQNSAPPNIIFALKEPEDLLRKRLSSIHLCLIFASHSTVQIRLDSYST